MTLALYAVRGAIVIVAACAGWMIGNGLGYILGVAL